jgi:hypothetical protein
MRAQLSDAVELKSDLATIEAQPGTPSAVNAERVGFDLAHTRTSYSLRLVGK